MARFFMEAYRFVVILSRMRDEKKEIFNESLVPVKLMNIQPNGCKIKGDVFVYTRWGLVTAKVAPSEAYQKMQQIMHIYLNNDTLSQVAGEFFRGRF